MVNLTLINATTWKLIKFTRILGANMALTYDQASVSKGGRA